MEFSVSVPLDSDGFLRRECPTCGGEFKWRGSPDCEVKPQSQYFCPLCGAASGHEFWWTQAQVQAFEAAAAPLAMRLIQDELSDAFRGSKNIKFESSGDTGGTPVTDPLHEPDDMTIVYPPCHPGEPIKVPENSEAPIHCLLCGEPFAV